MKFYLLLLAALPLLAFHTLAQEPITLTPYTDDTFNVSGVAPEGWTNIAPGVYARRASATDTTLMAQQAAPVTMEQLWTSLLPQLGLDEVPESTETLQTEALQWTLYQVNVPVGDMTIAVDVAVAEKEGTSYVVLLQTSADEYEALHEQVFLPAVNAFTPAPAAEATPEVTEEVPYIEEEVTFENGDITLAGTLTLPEGEGPHPAMILISGSGPQDRDESLEPIAQIKPFRLIADHLTRHGVAVLRYDDRGVGGSGGTFATATLTDFASDAEAAIAYLRTRDDINGEQVGILGHSEGGIIAPMVAQNADAAFIIALSGTAVSGTDMLVKQNERVYQTQDYDQDTIDDLLAKLRTFLEAVIADEPDEATVDAALYALVLGQLQALPADQTAGIEDLEAEARNLTDQQIAGYGSEQLEQLRMLLLYNPAETWAEITVPVLALFGGLDVQVDAEQNVAPLEAALESAGNEDYTIEVFPTANHLFQDAETGAVAEYSTLEQTFLPDLLPTITDWLLARVDVAAQ